MPGALLLTRDDPDSLEAAEFRYLRSRVQLAAERALGPLVEDPAADWELAFLVASPRAFVGEATLRALRRGLDDGAEVALPHRLSDTPRLASRPLHTLRAFEILESEILESDVPTRPPAAEGSAPVAWAPVCLIHRTGLEKILARWTLEEILQQPARIAEVGLSSVRTGLFHEFVDYYGAVRSDIEPFLPQPCREVLEVGCGRGATGAWLRKERGCRVTGVELNPVVAQEAAQALDRVIAGDVEDVPLDGTYDAVLALELFEHLAEPLLFLHKVRPLVRAGGRIILSVPNVGHWAVVEDLLAGRWDYLPIGLLCYTHLRFFTRATLTDWLESAGFRRFELCAQTSEPSPRLEALAASGLEIDRESLRTSGFYAVLHA